MCLVGTVNFEYFYFLSLRILLRQMKNQKGREVVQRRTRPQQRQTKTMMMKNSP